MYVCQRTSIVDDPFSTSHFRIEQRAPGLDVRNQGDVRSLSQKYIHRFFRVLLIDRFDFRVNIRAAQK